MMKTSVVAGSRRRSADAGPPGAADIYVVKRYAIARTQDLKRINAVKRYVIIQPS